MATKGNGEMDLPSFVRSYVIYYSKNGIRWSKAKASYESEVCYLDYHLNQTLSNLRRSTRVSPKKQTDDE